MVREHLKHSVTIPDYMDDELGKFDTIGDWFADTAGQMRVDWDYRVLGKDLVGYFADPHMAMLFTLRWM